MKAIIILLTAFLTAFQLSAQKVDLDLCEVYKSARELNSTQPLSKYLEDNSIDLSNFQKSELHSMRAEINLKIWKRTSKEKSAERDSLIEVIKNDFTKAIELSEDKSQEIRNKWRRFNSMEGLDLRYEEMDSDSIMLKFQGQKFMKSGIGLSAKLKYDNDFWFGGEFSLLSAYIPAYKIKDDNGEVLYQEKYSASFSMFIVGYAHNMSEKDFGDLNFSLIRIEAPFYIDIFQFGSIFGPENNKWYYRPEIGLGYSLFHLSAGYNIFFNREQAEGISRFMTNFRIKYTF